MRNDYCPVVPVVPEALPDALPLSSTFGVPLLLVVVLFVRPNPREKKNKANNTRTITTIAVMSPLLRAGATASSLYRVSLTTSAIYL